MTFRFSQEVMHHKEAAQKAALQALRDASAAETLVRVLKYDKSFF